MTTLQNNPFHRPNPFSLYKHQRFELPHLQTNNSQQHGHLIYKESPKPQQPKIFTNNWCFNQNNLVKKVDFTKKYDMAASQVSDFEMKMKMSNIGIPNNNYQKLAYAIDTKKENPFYRKNLLGSKEDSQQVDFEQSMYRNKAKSSYQTVRAAPLVHQTYQIYDAQNYVARPYRESITKDQNLIISKYAPQIVSLSYSPTPPTTKRQSSNPKRQQSTKQANTQLLQPKVLTIKGKSYFHTDVSLMD